MGRVEAQPPPALWASRSYAFFASELCQTWSSCLLLWPTGSSENRYFLKRMTWNRNDSLLGILTLSQSNTSSEHCLNWSLQPGSFFPVLQLLHCPALSCKRCLHMLACHKLCPFGMLPLFLLQPHTSISSLSVPTAAASLKEPSMWHTYSYYRYNRVAFLGQALSPSASTIAGESIMYSRPPVHPTHMHFLHHVATFLFNQFRG